MKITLVMAGDEEGGLEKHVVELANGLTALGQHVSLIAHEKYRDRVSSVDFVAVDLSKSRRNPFVLWQLYKAIQGTSPDVIHVHANKAVSMVAPLLKWLKIPAVATLHNLKKSLGSFEQFDRVIAVSRRVASQFTNQQRVRVVHNGIKPPALNASILFPTEHIPHFQLPQCLAVGRLVPAKGFDLLIEAWQGIEGHLSIAGDGPQFDLLQTKINELGLSERISLLGHRTDIIELMAKSDCFIISSRNEGGPYTLSEALLMRCPVLSTDVGMVAEILPSVYVCPPDDVKVLHELIRKYINQLGSVKQDFESIYKLAQEQLTLQAMIQQTLAVYREVMPKLQQV